jgi:peptidyl-prolyl cis-trans isomerase A (cyclophilin A)
MKIFFSKLTLIFILLFCLSNFESHSQETVVCEINTSLGNILIEVDQKKAPITATNFLKYVDNKAYTNSSFFRVCTKENEANRDIPIEVIQGGNIPDSLSLDPIKLETTYITGLKHVNGAVSMARAGVDTATSSFFICINDQRELDFKGKRNKDGLGFAAFGKVIKGMEVVLEIQKQKNEEQYLIDPVSINSITRVEN